MPTEPGMWPAPLWFRPLNSSDGEIDVCETWPYDWPNLGRPVFVATIHNAYSASQHQNFIFDYDDLPNTDPTAPHTYSVEKTSGRMRFECDGVLVGEWRDGGTA